MGISLDFSSRDLVEKTYVTGIVRYVQELQVSFAQSSCLLIVGTSDPWLRVGDTYMTCGVRVRLSQTG
jgi:hypothetical protein